MQKAREATSFYFLMAVSFELEEPMVSSPEVLRLGRPASLLLYSMAPGSAGGDFLMGQPVAQNDRDNAAIPFHELCTAQG